MAKSPIRKQRDRPVEKIRRDDYEDGGRDRNTAPSFDRLQLIYLRMNRVWRKI